MRKIIFIAFCLPLIQLLSTPLQAQSEKTKNDTREIIIIKNGDKEKKLTIETKDGEVFINGKPSSEYKDGDVSVIKRNFQNGYNFNYSGDTSFFETWGNKLPFLGVTTEKAEDGAKITKITKGSAAEKAGLKEGDVITRLGDKKISNPEDLMDAVKKYKIKDDVTLNYKRDGRQSETNALLGESNMFNAFNYNDYTGKSFSFTMPKLPALPRMPYTFAFNYGQRLGVSIEDADNDNGAKITDVNDDSPAAKAGLKENDIITEVNGKNVKNVNDVRKEIADVKDKISYNIKAKRNGSEMNFEIKIPKRVNKANI